MKTLLPVLLAALVSALSAGEAAPSGLAERYVALAKSRQRNLDRLDAYIRNGVFPLNLDFPGQLVPYFVDAKGTPCAVAHFLREDGLGDVVSAVVKADNHVRVMDVKEGPLADWILRSGLTQEECAEIQPTYGFREQKPLSDEEKAKMEQKRVRDRLTQTLQKLRGATHRSLPVALRRAAPKSVFVIRKWLEDRDLPAPGGGTIEYRETLHNPTADALEFRVAFLDEQGALLRETPWTALPAGGRHHIPLDEKGLWGFLEWRGGTEAKPGLVQVDYLVTQR